jgi:hypothetical protein
VSTTPADEHVPAEGAGALGASPEDELARVQAELRLAEQTIEELCDQIADLGRLEEERQAEIGQIEMDHRAALTELRVANVVALGAIEEARQAELGQIQIDHREAFAAAEARYKADLEQQFAAHVLLKTELEAAHAEALGDVKRASDELFGLTEGERDQALALAEEAELRAAKAEARVREQERQIGAQVIRITELQAAQAEALGDVKRATEDLFAALEHERDEALASAEQAKRRASEAEARGAQREQKLAAQVTKMSDLQAAHGEALDEAKRAAEGRIVSLERERDEALALVDEIEERARADDARWAERERQLAEVHARDLALFEELRVEAESEFRAKLAAAEEARARAAHAIDEAQDADRARATTSAAHAEQLADNHRQELAALATEHAQAIASERSAFEQMLSALQDELTERERRLQEVRAVDERERETMRTEHAVELAELEARNAELDSRIVELEGELRREQVGLRERKLSIAPGPELVAQLAVEAEPGAAAEQSKSLWGGARPRAPRVHASLGEALLAASQGEDADEEG